MTWKETIDLSTILSGLGTIVSAFIAYLVLKQQKTRNKYDQNLEKPILNFLNFKDKGWVLMNIGKGAATTIRLMEKPFSQDWCQPVIGYSMPANSMLEIKPILTNSSDILVASYTDINDKLYLVECKCDTCSIYEYGEKNWPEDLYKRTIDNPTRTNMFKFINPYT